ncbi:hypothetical protein LMG29542_07189 [Paraburkholderia humisilvae]|uniref:Uncharacterized protein n=1 Tax=Paraburkholderia humisilvae TaxID=627669 RepID=A0A6J5F3J6_9BURK|nr:hypothetical protein LMG29542_07189 [Paraburkholderia humisilvae]
MSPWLHTSLFPATHAQVGYADGTAGLVTSLVGGRDNDVCDFTSHFTDALNFRRVQGVKPVFVLWSLAANTPCPPEPHAQLYLPFGRRAGQLAFDVTQQPSQYRTLTLDYTTQTLELLRVRIAARATTQKFALAFVGLLQVQAGASCQLHKPGARHAQQTTVGRIGDRLLLHGGVDNHPLEFARRDRLHLHCGGDRRRQQFLDTRFAQGLPEAN